MIFAVAIMLVAFVVGILQATYVLIKNPKETANRLFAVFSGIFCLWYIGTAFQVSAATEALAVLWFRIGTAGWIVFVPLWVHFVLALTDNAFVPKHRWFLPALYAPGAVMTVANLVWNLGMTRFIQTGFGWTYTQNFGSLWLQLTFVHAVTYIAAGTVMLLRWGRRSGDPRRRAQSRAVILSVAVGMTLYSLTAALSFLPGLNYLPSISPACTLLWLAGSALAILRHKLMSISPTDAAATIFETMADGILLVDRTGIVVNANPAASEILRSAPGTLIGSRLEQWLPNLTERRGSQAAGAVKDLETTYESGGATLFLSVSVSGVLDRSGGRYGKVIALRDITARKHAENELHHMATHDTLTGLPNRTLLNDRLKNALSRAQRYKALRLAVLFIDLDKFKDINDRYGHDAGDVLLREAARRLTKSVREYDTVCRLGGDEFVVVLTDLADTLGCEAVVQRVQSAFRAPMRLESLEVTVTVSIGVSLYPDNSSSQEELFKFADMALYGVKSSGRNGYRFYTAESDIVTRKAEALERDMPGALSRDEFEVYYQPIYDLTSGRPIALEALLRWNHPSFGLVMPMDFIPVAERTGYIVPIGEWVLTHACRQLALWREVGIEIKVAVNVSAKQFQDPAIVQKFTRIAAECGVDPRLIELEFTESTAMVDVERTVKTAKELNEHGIDLIVDDFGSGFSSMAWLKQLNPKALKIDKFFIQNVVSNTSDAAIVRAIVTMAHSMGMLVIAEGIESKDQLDAIKNMQWERSADLACDCAQGFLFSRPLSASAAARLFLPGGDTVNFG
ncbi:MAG TPA: EAL domain-containing protein [Spirochaetia bacterium]|nr:EAL domain-containing protein [Spirochaetia bacterium]